MSGLIISLRVIFTQAYLFLRDFAIVLHIGLVRLIRDVLSLNGGCFFNDDQTIATLVLKYYDRFSYQFGLALRSLLEPWHITVILDKC